MYRAVSIAGFAGCQALNEMIDEQGRRLAALRNRVPNIVLLALYGIAAVATAFAAYGSGLEARRIRLPIYLMALLLSAVILLVSRQGLVPKLAAPSRSLCKPLLFRT